MDGRARVRKESVIAIIIAVLSTASLLITVGFSAGGRGNGLAILEKFFSSDEKIDASVLDKASDSQSYTIKKNGDTVVKVKFKYNDSDNSYRYDISANYNGVKKGVYIYKPDKDRMEIYEFNKSSEKAIEKGKMSKYSKLMSKLKKINPINYVRSNMNFEKATAMKFFGVLKMYTVKNDAGETTDVLTFVGKSMNKYIKYISKDEILEMSM